MSSSASTRGRRSTGSLSLFGLIRILARLTPRQISDEFSLALEQMKQKGIKAGVAAAFLVVALILVLFFAVALIVAAILGLATILPPWLAALVVAAVFLVLAAILGLIGVSRFKKALPLLPEEAIRGVRYDLGVLKEGRSFNPAALDIRKPKDDKKDDAKDSAPKKPTPSYEELRGRSGERRTHIAEARDSLGTRVDFKARYAKFQNDAKAKKEAKAAQAASIRGGAAGRDGVAAVAVQKEVPHNISLADRWKPLSVLAGSVAALVVFLRRLLSR
ncbi:phage holin family protein [Arthrobacter sp. Br18]|uniref:phage holin family protein n=1 Tax=Arthrobacter sp. Br18 TaxID=1312954 RepID=UPI00047DB185|nr:phage holin family protein [Arthrobacter sp. Br18]